MYNKQYHRSFDLNSPNISIKLRLMFHLILNVILLMFLVFALISKKSSFEFNSFAIVSIIGFILSIILYTYYINKLIKRKKDFTDSITMDYITNFPSDHNPAIVAYLMQGGNFDGNDLTSTLLDLVVKKYFIIEREYRIEDLLNDKKNIVIKLNSNANLGELCEYERYLVEWFIKELGENDEIRTSKLRESLKNDEQSGKKFLQWQALVIDEYKKESFIEDSPKRNNSFIFIILLIFLFHGLSLFSMNADFNVPFIVIYSIGVLAHLLTIKTSFNDVGNAQILTDYGKEITKKWNGFVNYVDTHSIIKEHHIEYVALYEKYFVYAVALNIANKVNKDMSKNYGWELYKIR